MSHSIAPPPDTSKVPRRKRMSEPPLYGFPQTLLDQVDEAFPGNAGTCGLCGDTILGGRHRVIDAIRERLVVGEGDEVVDDYDVPWAWAAVAVAASYEHDKALRRQRRAVGEANE